MAKHTFKIMNFYKQVNILKTQLTASLVNENLLEVNLRKTLSNKPQKYTKNILIFMTPSCYTPEDVHTHQQKHKDLHFFKKLALQSKEMPNFKTLLNNQTAKFT